MALKTLAKKLFGSANERRLKPLFRRVEAINALEDEIARLSDAELKAQTDRLKARLADGETLADQLHVVLALSEGAFRRLARGGEGF
ncbi:MAG: hypothetical protein AAFV51_04125, partial [Pseudomonadota bacterium]